MFKSRSDKTKSFLVKYLREGMSIQKLCMCLALGIVLGIFPVLGMTTVLCALAAIVLRLNLPLIQLVNYAVYPLQLFLLVFFYGVGSRLLSGRNLPYSRAEIVGILQNDMWGSMIALWDMTLAAILLWALSAPILAFFLYVGLKPLVRKLSTERQTSVPSFESTD
jgi:uncharacterized protein (DUF2062 family)